LKSPHLYPTISPALYLAIRRGLEIDFECEFSSNYPVVIIKTLSFSGNIN